MTDYLEIEEIFGIKSRFSNPVGDYTYRSTDDMEEIVRNIRMKWNIGMDPVHNIIQLLEDLEIKVIEIEEEENLFDGLAVVVEGEYAVIVVNKNFTVERKRFTLLHELGHLLLNLAECNEKEEESICHKFAAEFLFPKESVFYEFGCKRNAVSLMELIKVQKKYGMSIRAIVYRLYDLGIINKTRYENFYKRINSDKDWKRKVDQERFTTPEISFRYEQLVYRALSSGFISSDKAAVLLSVNINEVLASHSL